MHDAVSVRAIMRQGVVLLLLLAGACGSTAKSGPDGGCAPNQVWCPGCEPGTGACYVGGCPGAACPPLDGGAGGAAGTGGGSGSGGSTGGGAGGTPSACQAVLALDRSCSTPADCFTGAHVIDCCGNGRVMGFRNAVASQFQTLEAACAASYPACGCPAGPPAADDGSQLRFSQQAGVTCLQGKCTTFVPECGQPCGAGTTCFSCANGAATFAACATMCADSTACTDPTLPLCQMGSSGNTSGKFCTAANVGCDTR